jgi:hypothetical protein
MWQHPPHLFLIIALRILGKRELDFEKGEPVPRALFRAGIWLPELRSIARRQASPTSARFTPPSWRRTAL